MALGDLLGVGGMIRALNHTRYAMWDTAHTKPAILMFNGEAYRSLKAWEMSEDQLQWAQGSVRIICGLYGLLKPLDAIKPYRLDMGLKASQR